MNLELPKLNDAHKYDIWRELIVALKIQLIKHNDIIIVYYCHRNCELIYELINSGLKVTGGKMTPSGVLGAFITKVKRGSIADVAGQLKSGMITSLLALNLSK